MTRRILVFDENPIDDDPLLRELIGRGYESRSTLYSQADIYLDGNYEAVVVRIPELTNETQRNSVKDLVRKIRAIEAEKPIIALDNRKDPNFGNIKLTLTEAACSTVSTRDYAESKVIDVIDMCIRTYEQKQAKKIQD